MIAVIFELEPNAGQAETYFALAAKLGARLEGRDGFLSIERFESVARPGRYLSLSFWRDEAAVTAWRGETDHRRAQSAGRGAIFADYRLRVAEVKRDYGLFDRLEAPPDSIVAHGA